MERTGQEVVGKLEKVEYKKGHPSRALVGEEELVATAPERKRLGPEWPRRPGGRRDRAPTEVPPAPDPSKQAHHLLRIEKGVSIGEEVVVRAYTKGNVTYYNFQPADEDESPVRDKSRLPQPLFLAAGALTLLTLFLL